MLVLFLHRFHRASLVTRASLLANLCQKSDALSFSPHRFHRASLVTRASLLAKFVTKTRYSFSPHRFHRASLVTRASLPRESQQLRSGAARIWFELPALEWSCLEASIWSWQLCFGAGSFKLKRLRRAANSKMKLLFFKTYFCDKVWKLQNGMPRWSSSPTVRRLR